MRRHADRPGGLSVRAIYFLCDPHGGDRRNYWHSRFRHRVHTDPSNAGGWVDSCHAPRELIPAAALLARARAAVTQ